MSNGHSLTYAFSKKLANLEAAFAMFAAYFNYEVLPYLVHGCLDILQPDCCRLGGQVPK